MSRCLEPQSDYRTALKSFRFYLQSLNTEGFGYINQAIHYLDQTIKHHGSIQLPQWNDLGNESYCEEDLTSQSSRAIRASHAVTTLCDVMESSDPEYLLNEYLGIQLSSTAGTQETEATIAFIIRETPLTIPEGKEIRLTEQGTKVWGQVAWHMLRYHKIYKLHMTCHDVAKLYNFIDANKTTRQDMGVMH